MTRRTVTVSLMVTLLLLGCGAFAAAAGSQSATQPKVVKVGILVDETGPYTHLGTDVLHGVQMAIAKVNADGSTGKYKIEPIILDIQTNPNQAVVAARKLISDKVAVVIGPEFSTAALAVAPLFQKAHIPEIVDAGDESIAGNPANPWTFMISSVGRVESAKDISYLKCKGITKIAMLHDTEALGIAGTKDAEALAHSHHIAVVTNQSYDLHATDMMTQLLAIKNSPAQAIIYYGVGTAPAIVAKEYQSLGMTQPIILQTGNADQDFRTQTGSNSNGFLAPAWQVQLGAVLPKSNPQRATILAFQRAYQKKYHKAPSEFVAMGYDAVGMVAHSLKDGAVTPQAIRQHLEGPQPAGLTGPRNYTKTDHVGINPSDLIMVRWQANGTLKPTKCQ